MSLSKGTYLVKYVGLHKDLYLSVRLLEVHNETQKNATLEPVGRLEPLYQVQRLLLFHYYSSLDFFSVRFFFFLLYFGSLVFATVCELGLSYSLHGENSK